MIFNKIVYNFLSRFSDAVKEAIPKLVDATIEIYNQAKLELLPTPSKSHYLFSLRDISKVFQGCCNAYQKNTTTTRSLVRQWWHENARVYHDRLTTDADRVMFLGNCDKLVESIFELDVKELHNCERI